VSGQDLLLGGGGNFCDTPSVTVATTV
jgi:hypothetical protein